jgi:hypothetical protein
VIHTLLRSDAVVVDNNLVGTVTGARENGASNLSDVGGVAMLGIVLLVPEVPGAVCADYESFHAILVAATQQSRYRSSRLDSTVRDTRFIAGPQRRVAFTLDLG